MPLDAQQRYWEFVQVELQLVFVHYMMPETRGISLEELSKKLISENEAN